MSNGKFDERKVAVRYHKNWEFKKLVDTLMVMMGTSLFLENEVRDAVELAVFTVNGGWKKSSRERDVKPEDRMLPACTHPYQHRWLCSSGEIMCSICHGRVRWLTMRETGLVALGLSKMGLRTTAIWLLRKAALLKKAGKIY